MSEELKAAWTCLTCERTRGVGESLKACLGCGKSTWSYGDNVSNTQEAIKARNTRANGWVSVEDRLPFDGEYTLVHPVFISSVSDDEPRHVLRFKEGRWVYYLGGSVHTTFGHTVTHWQPLPSPPLEVDK